MYSDPIADLLTRIRNAHMAGHSTVSLPSSKLKLAITQILKQEGFIEDFSVQADGADAAAGAEVADGAAAAKPGFQTLRLALKYVGTRRERRPVISGIERISTPGRRVY